MKVDGVNVPVAHAYGHKAALESEETPEEPGVGVTTAPSTINPVPDELESEDNGQAPLSCRWLDISRLFLLCGRHFTSRRNLLRWRQRS